MERNKEGAIWHFVFLEAFGIYFCTSYFTYEAATLVLVLVPADPILTRLIYKS